MMRSSWLSFLWDIWEDQQLWNVTDMQQKMVWPVSNCLFTCFQCAFSHGGHLFAAVNGNVIHIYSSTTFDNLLNFKGHNGKVRQDSESETGDMSMPWVYDISHVHSELTWTILFNSSNIAAVMMHFDPVGAVCRVEYGWQPSGVMRHGWSRVWVEYPDQQARVWECAQVLLLQQRGHIVRWQEHLCRRHRQNLEGDPRLSGNCHQVEQSCKYSIPVITP